MSGIIDVVNSKST